ncbi:hypothetical protein C6P45_004807 [Maudiozyma exigua]|uniref:SWA2-like ubiquitin-associated domain-containing protein n=1 Tax=Maudiozyma exigua TaxID=34358 RepID=A0A9P7B9N6_MAUEX|nr:hypothetical protein C6P45_004807 [Kazachstania exigua]
MSDPFANLLTSLKEDNKKKSANNSSTTVPNIIGSVPIKPNANSNNIISNSSHKISVNDSIHNDLDDLFGFSSQTKTPTPIQQQSKIALDDFMSVFDNFDSIKKETAKQIPVNDTHSTVDTSPEHINDIVVVVDEVKDMEVAQLMSLGMSIEKANKYYDKGILYDDIIKKRNTKQMTERHKERERIGTTYFDNNNTNKKNISSSFFSAATDFLNKGKDLVDQLTAYPDEEGNRLYKYTERDDDSIDVANLERNRYKPSVNKEALLDDETNPFDINNYESSLQAQPSKTSDTPLFETPTYSNNSDIIQPENKDSDLLQDFDQKVVVSQPTSGSEQYDGSKENFEATQPDSVLLDFDNNVDNTSPDILAEGNNNITNVFISEIELSGYNEYNLNAKEFFSKGDYSSAFNEYEKSLNTLPSTHPLRIVALSNMMISQLKIGDYSKCVSNAKIALSMIPEDKKLWGSTIQNSRPKKTYKDLWTKILMRQAEAYEHQENFQAALDCIQLLLNNGVHDPKIMSAKRRCQMVVNPEQFMAKPKPTAPKSNPVVEPASKKQKDTPSTVHKNTEEIKKAHLEEKKIEERKEALYDVVHDKIELWKDNKDYDIRFLLSNLSVVLTWCDWKPVSTADLVIPKKVKITFLKAIAKLHPDKLSSDISLENRMIAENVFSVLSVSWEKFKADNNMN